MAVAAVALLAKLTVPAVAAVVELWLLAPMLAGLIALCTGLCFALLHRLAKSIPISALIQGS